MYRIKFYKDRQGRQPVKDYLRELKESGSKDSRIKLGKIYDYVGALSKKGTRVGAPIVKHIEGDIWELRPLRDRIFFVGWHGGAFVLLHPFMKTTQKTPKREIDKAKREYADLLERGIEDEK